MTRDDIIRMAQEAHKDLVTVDYPGHVGQLDPWTLRLLERFAALVAAAEQPKPEPVAYFDLQKQVFYWARPTMIDVPKTIALEPLPLYAAPPDIEALRRDAERYRWLKAKVEDYDGHACFPEVLYPAPIPDRSPFDAVDAAIDAAMQEAALRREEP